MTFSVAYFYYERIKTKTVSKAIKHINIVSRELHGKRNNCRSSETGDHIKHWNFFIQGCVNLERKLYFDNTHTKKKLGQITN